MISELKSPAPVWRARRMGFWRPQFYDISLAVAVAIAAVSLLR